MDFLILPLATAGLKAQSVAVIRLIVERVNELVSLFRSISVHYGLIQSALEWLCVVQQTPSPPPLLALSDLLASLSLLFPLLCPCFPVKTQSEGWIWGVGTLSVQFFFPGGGKERRWRNEELMSWGSAWLSEQWGKSWKWLVTEAPPTRAVTSSLHCDWSLCCGCIVTFSALHRCFVQS